jgi:cytochrome c-type biogenesis protein CcmH
VTFFLLGCAALLLLSGLFYLVPTVFRGDTEKTMADMNVDWFRQREEELQAEGNSTLMQDAQQRLLEDLSGDMSATPSNGPVVRQQSRFRGWLLFPIVAVSSSALYYLLGSASDVVISEQLSAISQQGTPQQMSAVIEAIEKRSLQRPKNLHYLSLLGRYYMGQEDYIRAVATYESLALEVPEDSQVLALAAQAGYLANNRQLSGNGRLQAEQSLAIDPEQRTALGLLGMASFEQGQFSAALNYWQRLLALEPPNSETAQMILGIIERARQQIASSEGGSIEPQLNPQPMLGVTVNVSAPPGNAVADTDTVFVLARGANADSRMPIAVQRLTGSQLPFELRLDDSSSMAGQKISQAELVVVVVQVSPDGKPGEANASWLGNGGPVAPSLDTTPLEIVLRPAS